MITIEDFKKINTKKTRLIGLDLGSKRIGVSICDDKRLIATPFKTIKKTTGKNFTGQLKEIVEEYQVGGIVVGNPINMDGSLGKSAQSVSDIVKNIKDIMDVPIILWDERLSTVGAFKLSSQLDINLTKREQKIDENAAAFILQGAIDYLNN